MPLRPGFEASHDVCLQIKHETLCHGLRSSRQHLIAAWRATRRIDNYRLIRYTACVFDYLVTSRTRRQLLRRLWGDRARGSVSALARASGVSFGAAHRELEAMKAAGLTVAERDGIATVYRANLPHPQADVLTALLKATPRARGDSEEQRLRGRLAALGAPLAGPAPSNRRLPAEEVLADGLVLAHHSPTVARVLPVAFWRQRDKLDYERLKRVATQRDERQALGFYLELTGRLGGDWGLARRASGLRDRRRTALRPFFSGGRRSFARAAAQEKSPALARRRAFLMNMGLDSFRTVFEKFARRSSLSGRSRLPVTRAPLAVSDRNDDAGLSVSPVDHAIRKSCDSVVPEAILVGRPSLRSRADGRDGSLQGKETTPRRPGFGRGTRGGPRGPQRWLQDGG